MWIAAQIFAKFACNDGKETLVFKGFFYFERQLSVFKSCLSKVPRQRRRVYDEKARRLSLPLFVCPQSRCVFCSLFSVFLWILRCAQYDKLVWQIHKRKKRKVKKRKKREIKKEKGNKERKEKRE